MRPMVDLALRYASCLTHSEYSHGLFDNSLSARSTSVLLWKGPQGGHNNDMVNGGGSGWEGRDRERGGDWPWRHIGWVWWHR